MAQQVEGDEAPVDAVEAEVLGQPVVILVLPRVQGLDVFHMVCGGEPQLFGELVELGGHCEPWVGGRSASWWS